MTATAAPPQAPATAPTRALTALGWSTLIANAALVVTGGAVRLTGSGLGCPTWPRCTEDSFTPHGALSLHQAVEFGNRTLTFVLVAIAIATYVAAWRNGRRDLRRLALVLALGIPAQAVIGGITVLTGLNPWVVSLHLIVTMAIIALAVRFLRMLPGPLPEADAPRLTQALTRSTYAAAVLVIYLGTVVTGAGPHAGDVNAPRNGLDPLEMSQLHADAVFLLIGLTLATLLLTRTGTVTDELRRAVAVLVVVELAQAAIGYVQYFTNLPEILVGLHMAGAATLMAVVTWVVLAGREAAHR